MSSGIPRAWAATDRSPGVNLLPDLSARTVGRIAERVRAVKSAGDVVVASLHWGGNWGYEISGEEIAFAHGLVDEAAVDVVYGHSSHHPKAIELYRGRPILYGCGDFLDDYEGIGGYEEFRDDLVLVYFPTMRASDGRLSALALVPLAGFAARRRWGALVLGGAVAMLALMLTPALFTHFSDFVSLSQARRPAGHGAVGRGTASADANGHAGDDFTWTGAPPVLPPLAECVALGPWPGTVAEDGTEGFASQIRMLFDPAVVGWRYGTPSGMPEMRGYFGLREEREPDALLLALAVDGLPPVVFGLGATGWAPTVELTMHMRMVPAPGPLRVAARCRHVSGGWFDEEAEVWDAVGNLVAQSRQIARVGCPPSRPA